VLFEYHLFDAIMDGRITVTFRNWSRPQAKSGARHRLNSEGAIAIQSVTKVNVADIASQDVRRAGFASLDALRAELTRVKPLPSSGLVYRVEFRFIREADPRAQLAADQTVTDVDVTTIAAKLDRMDARSEHGAWTRETLRLIADNPRVPSTTLAARVGRERFAFKTDVRKLKALGLTISHDIGYEISPRGRAFLIRDADRS
jgi:hypothetical protein